MKRTTKIGISIVSALGITISAAAAAFAWKDEQRERQATVAMWEDSQQTNGQSTDIAQPTGTAQPTARYEEIEGQVKSYQGNNITINTPFGEERAFTVSERAYIDDTGLPLQKGALVEMKVRGETVYHLETERTIESNGIIRAITDKDVTVEQNGSTKTFQKGTFFHLDDEGVGNIVGLPAAIQWNKDMQITEVEIDD